RRRWRRLTL
nr:Chain C, Latent membrane protein 2 [human gammaherpesvirus 4]